MNHFKWDKDLLMEKYYDGDQEIFFREAHVMRPLKKTKRATRSRSANVACEICCSEYRPNVSVIILSNDIVKCNKFSTYTYR